MAIEIKTTNLAEIKALAEEHLSKMVEAEEVSVQVECMRDIEECIKAYAAQSKANTYKELAESDDPMKNAVLKFFYPVIKYTEKKDKDTGIIIRAITDGGRPIDLGDLHKRLNGIGADHKWLYTAQKLNFYLTKRVADEVGATIKSDAFRMTEIAREIDLGKNPTSNTNMLKTLQAVITQMLGEGYKATSHDVKYLLNVYANDNKKSKTGITAANHKTLRNYLKKVCYRILTGGTGYDVDQKEIKEDK